MFTRRDFLAGGVALGATSLARTEIRVEPTTLRLERRNIEVNGKSASIFSIRQPNGVAGITTYVATPFRVRVENHIEVPSLIHWHGLTPPWRQDGVPEISGPAISPGGDADYNFPLRRSGTYWMHSHYGLQEQSLASAPLIIKDGGEKSEEREIVLMLADFSFTPASEIFLQLRRGKAQGGEARRDGMQAMKSMPDLNDVRYDAFLANERTLDDPEVTNVDPGELVRLRIINSSSMSGFHIDLGSLQGDLIAVDGAPVLPVRGSVFPIAVAQRLDIALAIPKFVAAYPVLAVLEGERRRTGIVIRAGKGKITPISGMSSAAAGPLTLDLERSLRAATPLLPRTTDRTHVINLTGSMHGYEWSINDVAWTKDTPPFMVAAGERVELVMVNKTMMPHPMHLHGHSFQVVSIDGNRFPGAVRDTVLVPPRTTVTVAFNADNPGWWAFHCHLLYHQHAGMFQTIRYG